MEALEQMPLVLMMWYREHARKLPWREDRSPYSVWISEIMLQQTRVAAVLTYYQRFLSKVPTVAHLAQLPEDQLMKLWQGLGYYRRAQNMQRAAREIMEIHQGVFPNTYPEIRRLPGIGEYTAGAIGSIAFGIPVPAVDGNVLRVVSRLTGDTGDIAAGATRRRITQALQQVIPLEYPGEFNQACMELGATVCLPNGAPLCDQCPLAQLCYARREDCTETLPVKKARAARRVEKRRVYLLFSNHRVALRQRPQRGLLAGMWEFPQELLSEEEIPRQLGTAWQGGEVIPGGKHIFTHIEWHMTGCRGEIAQPDALPPEWVWASAQDLEQVYAIPNAFGVFWPRVMAELRGGLG